jgi:hypothetical protein
MTVVNASSNLIIGAAWHTSGDGGNEILSPDPALVVTLVPFGTTDAASRDDIVVRNDHDDYWYWEPKDVPPTKCRKNCKASTIGACLVITDDLLVVVTSDNGVATQPLSTAAAAAS